MIDGRISALSTLLCSLVLVLRLRPSLARAAWCALLAAGLAHALVSAGGAANLVNINVAHHYLGAKYAAPYADFYRLHAAALERPQVRMRDLTNPATILRDDYRAERAYYLELLRGVGLRFEPTASTEELRRLANESGAVRDEAQRILRERFDAEEQARFLRRRPRG